MPYWGYYCSCCRADSWLGWAPIGPIVSRILGAALLAMAWGALRLWRGAAGPDARLWAETQLALAGLAGIGVLRHVLVAHWPAIVWILFALCALSVLTWVGVWAGERRYQKCDSACAHTNDRSIVLHRKLGFVEKGRCRRELFCNGQYYDEILFGMTREEFDAREKRR